MNHRLKDILAKTVFKAASVVNKIVPKNQNKILLYENNVGFQDNIRAVYDYMIEHEMYKQFQILISANKFIPQSTPYNVRTMNNLGGVINFFTTGHVFYCHGKIPMYPSNKQKVVQMWHGTPFKGNNVRQNRSVTSRSYYTNILSSSPYFEQIIIDNFYVNKENVSICGQPRTDVMFMENVLPSDLEGFNKIIMWMPTYRMSSFQGDIDVKQKSIVPIFDIDDFQQLEEELTKYNICLFIKLHPLQDLDLFRHVDYKHILFMSGDEFTSRGWELYRILSKIDALITDYSSVFYDFMLLDRPLGFAIDDIKEYENSRGFVVDDPEYFMAGEKIRTKEDFYKFIDHVANGEDPYKEQRNEVNRLTHTYPDGNNCKRALEIGGVCLD